MPTYEWYQQLIKPSWSPPAWLFGPVWTVLYVLIVISFGKVFLLAWQKQIGLMVALPFALNIIFNLIFTPIQFGLKSNGLAALDILLVLATLIWAMLALRSLGEAGLAWIIYVNIPYLLWVSFATILQLTITYLNVHK